MTKQYRNFKEQVTENLEIEELCNDLNEVDEFYWEALYQSIHNATTEKEVLESADLPLDTPTDTEDFYQLQDGYVDDCMESVYQLFKVTLKGDYNQEHERLMIFWNDEIESYVLPVLHFGTAWSYVGQVN